MQYLPLFAFTFFGGIVLGYIVTIGILKLRKRKRKKPEKRETLVRQPLFSGLTPLQDINMDEDDRNEWSLEHDDDC